MITPGVRLVQTCTKLMCVRMSTKCGLCGNATMKVLELYPFHYASFHGDGLFGQNLLAKVKLRLGFALVPIGQRVPEPFSTRKSVLMSFRNGANVLKWVMLMWKIVGLFSMMYQSLHRRRNFV